MCVDVEGFADGENDGVVQDEADNEKGDADIIWKLDMMEDLGVFPHNLATSSPLVDGDLVFLLTSNGVDEAHLEWKEASLLSRRRRLVVRTRRVDR
jgi:hypothetical protein